MFCVLLLSQTLFFRRGTLKTHPTHSLTHTHPLLVLVLHTHTFMDFHLHHLTFLLLWICIFLPGEQTGDSRQVFLSRISLSPRKKVGYRTWNRFQEGQKEPLTDGRTL